MIAKLVHAVAVAAALHAHSSGHHHAHRVLASEYGPKDSPGTLACHGRAKGIPHRLSYRTVGVANKTRRCGSWVWIRAVGHRRWLHVRVIDRGPYAAGRSFDLTYRTARMAGVAYPWSGGLWVR